MRNKEEAVIVKHKISTSACLILCIGTLLIVQSCSSLPPRNEASLELCQPLRYGIHSTDVTQSSILLWAQLEATQARFVVTGADKKHAGEWERVDQSGVYIQKFSGLRADSLYEYEIQAYHCRWAEFKNRKSGV